MTRILLVEDEAPLARALVRGLADERYAVDVCEDGEEGLWAASGPEYDLVVLDVMLPGLSGIEVCRRLRDDGRDVPILMLTARDAPADVVRGLDAGANDYLRKPFAFDELLARIRALLRTRSPARTSRLEVAGLVVDLPGRRVLQEGTEIPLTAKEFLILEYLALHAGEVVSKSRLAEAAWSRDELPDSNVIEVYIGNLRRKIGREDGPGPIETVRGAGYVLRGEP